ncbi:hypothetical protein [Mycolicibacterium thermoresistibile]
MQTRLWVGAINDPQRKNEADPRASKVAETVKTAADWVAEAAEKFGLGKIADTAKVVGKVARKFAIAPTLILQGGQKLIEHMVDQTGEGDPEWGQSFRTAGWK